jgi:hypothetical protein
LEGSNYLVCALSSVFFFFSFDIVTPPLNFHTQPVPLWLLALVRFNSTLQVPDLTQEQAGQNATATVRPIKFYHTKLAKSMVAYTRQNIPNGLNTMSYIFKEMDAKGVKYNLDTWVYKLQFFALRKDNRMMLKTLDTILERYTLSVDVFNIVTKVSKAKGSCTVIGV